MSPMSPPRTLRQVKRSSKRHRRSRSLGSVPQAQEQAGSVNSTTSITTPCYAEAVRAAPPRARLPASVYVRAHIATNLEHAGVGMSLGASRMYVLPRYERGSHDA